MIIKHGISILFLIYGYVLRYDFCYNLLLQTYLFNIYFKSFSKLWLQIHVTRRLIVNNDVIFFVMYYKNIS